MINKDQYNPERYDALYMFAFVVMVVSLFGSLVYHLALLLPSILEEFMRAMVHY